MREYRSFVVSSLYTGSAEALRGQVSVDRIVGKVSRRMNGFTSSIVPACVMEECTL